MKIQCCYIAQNPDALKNIENKLFINYNGGFARAIKY